MTSADPSKGRSADEERFAAAVAELTAAARITDADDNLAREFEIVAMLRSGSPALAPDVASIEAARQRLMTALARQPVDTLRPVLPHAVEEARLSASTARAESKEIVLTADVIAAARESLGRGTRFGIFGVSERTLNRAVTQLAERLGMNPSVR